MERYEETSYHIEVSHEPGTFKSSDMDYLTSDPKDAHKLYLFLREKYKEHEITITEIITIKTHEKISENKLESSVRNPL